MKYKIALVFLLLVFFSQTSIAFDCSKAFLQTDFVICSSPDILQSENELERVWHLLITSKYDAEKKQLHDEQTQWIKQYAQNCGLQGKGQPSEIVMQQAQPCVRQALLQRTEYLQKLLAAGNPVIPNNSIIRNLNSLNEIKATNPNRLSEQAIKNAEFLPLVFDRGSDGLWKTEANNCKVKLKNGEAIVCEENYSVGNIVFGDLNGDGIVDAAVNIAVKPIGGNSVSSQVIVFLNVGGKPQYAGGTYFAESNQPAALDSMEIIDGKIFMNILGMKEDDPHCCPSLKLKEVYQFNGKSLVQVDKTRIAQANNNQAVIAPRQVQPRPVQPIPTPAHPAPQPSMVSIMSGTLNEILISASLGALFGAFFSHKLRPFRKWIGILIALTLFGIGLVYFEPVRMFGGFIVAYLIVFNLLRIKTVKKNPTIYGSAEWATLEHLQRSGKLSDNGLFLGDFYQAGNRLELKYSGDRHLLTVAPTRSGKGVSSIIPNLLSYQGSMLVIDPKGENAKITARYRGAADGLRQAIHVVDPWGVTGEKVSCFNPLDWLSPVDEDISENAMILADSIITHHEGSNEFFDEESKALLMGLILYVALDENEKGNRTLGRVRDIIVSSDSKFEAVMQQMFKSSNPIVSSTAARTASKEIKLLSSVIASLQSHTHFLDSPRIRKSLSKSDFKFEDLKSSKMTIFLVLPADRLETFGRWLRLLIQQAITVNARNIAKKPDKPIIFLLDEMPALGRLTMVEQAYGLMAGFGMQLWGIVQDLSQLERVYDKGWETFIGNSGVLQYFGSRDQKTAEYFSKLCGVSTVEKVSFSSSIAKGFSWATGSSDSESEGKQTLGSSSTSTNSTTNTNTVSSDYIQRHLAYADELMVLHGGRQIVFIEHLNPIDARKISWYEDTRFQNIGNNLQSNNVS